MGAEAGHLSEIFVMHEIRAFLGYAERRVPMLFYRTKAGAEVDFVLDGGRVAVEAKLSDRICGRDLVGMNSFLAEYPEARAMLVCLEAGRRIVEKDGRRVEIVPWREFCAELWQDGVV